MTAGNISDILPELPQEHEITPGYVNDRGGYLSTHDFAEALAFATEGGEEPFDMVFFDQCFQGSYDVLYELQNYAEIFIASPNYAWLSAPYNHYIPRFKPGVTTEAMANAVIDQYQKSLDDTHPNAIFWIKSDRLPAIADAVNTLGDALTVAVQAGADAPILNATLNSKFVDTTQCGDGNFQLGSPDELIGANSFAQNLQTEFGTNDAYGVSNAAGALLTALANISSTHRTGTPYLATDAIWDYNDTLTLLAPLERTRSTDTIWRASVYTQTASLEAVWAAAPTYTLSIETPFASTIDGTWDDFIAKWYETPLTPTIGEWCHYIPPTSIADEVTETLDVTIIESAARSITGVTLQWSATTDEEATVYAIMVRTSNLLSWEREATVPLTQTTYLVETQQTGSVEYRVIAQDEDGVILAEGNAVNDVPVVDETQVPSEEPATQPEEQPATDPAQPETDNPAGIRIYLPVIQS
ncbi:MAG: clostripain-related cysteine peptidase [Chloroflexota bacterium]